MISQAFPLKTIQTFSVVPYPKMELSSFKVDVGMTVTLNKVAADSPFRLMLVHVRFACDKGKSTIITFDPL
jgi:hypothetical protein